MTVNLLSIGTPVIPSRICLGGADLGSAIPREKSFAILDQYAQLGGNVLDTADLYARMYKDGEGKSELTIGEWLKDRKCREKMIIITKGGHRDRTPYSRGRLGRDNVEANLTLSLKRLQLDSVDLYFLHHDEPARPVEEIVETMEYLRKKGYFRRYGLSNWEVERLEELRAHAVKAGVPGPAATETGYSLCLVPSYLAKKNEKNRMVFMGKAQWEWQKKSNLPSLAYTSQARGYFGAPNAAWAEGGFNGPVPVHADYDCEENRARLLSAVRLAKVAGVSANQVALAWLMHQPFAVYPIVATSKPERLEEAFGSLELKLEGILDRF